MSWNCKCELCRRAFTGRLETRRWCDFLLHRDGAVIRASDGDGEPVYLSERNGDVVVTTERMDEYRSLCESWGEEVLLLSYLSGCEVEPVEERNPFKNPSRRQLA
jgi:hypothetical protein